MTAPLADRIALVTGAGGGIGRATALELARRGATVAVHGFRNRDGGAETAGLVRQKGVAAELRKAISYQLSAFSSQSKPQR